MKIRHPLLIRTLSWTAAKLVRGWMGTLRFEYRPLGPNVDPRQPGLEQRYIYAFWHENLLLPVYQYARPDIYVLISRHADGQMIAELARHLGFQTVRGSTGRGGGVEAVRQILRLGQGAHIGVTPDGPRGPRRQVQPGLVYLAARTGLPIVPVGISFRRPWRMKSWDRFAVPKPFSHAYCVTPEPIVVPADVDKDQLEEHRLRIEEALWEVNGLADRWAAGEIGALAG